MFVSLEGKEEEGGTLESPWFKDLYLWIPFLLKVGRSDVVLNELFQEKANIPKEQRR